MARPARPRLTVKRKAYTRSDGTKVKATSFKTEDKGALGRTPKRDRWYRPSVHTGWEKGMPAGKRRQLVLDAHKGDALTSARSLIALHNVTTDSVTKGLAKQDYQYFLRMHRRQKGE